MKAETSLHTALKEKTKKVRVILADDHQLFREGLKRILNMEDDIEVVAEAADGVQIIELCNEYRPDIVLMDINMPVQNGVIATEKLTQYMPEIKVVILSIHDDESYVFETLRKGASGYLLKDMEADTLLHAIRAVFDGHAYIHPRVTGKLINQLRRMTYLDEVGNAVNHSDDRGAQLVPSEDNPLTRREAEVLRLLAEGLNNRAIGEHLIISEKTVKNHVSSILKKMKVNDRTHAVVNSIKNGWISL